MKVTTFRLENPTYEDVGDPAYLQSNAIYKVPVLPAYAIIDSRLDMENSLHVDAGYIPPRYELLEDRIVTPKTHGIIMSPERGILTIYHNGINNYKKLFPHVATISLQSRLAVFAEEAEYAFESQSWVSYCLMVGAVIEGLLYEKYGNKKFCDLIVTARDMNVISSEEATLIDKIRTTRNVIHANKHNKSIAGREEALYLSVAYDRLLKKNWGLN